MAVAALPASPHRSPSCPLGGWELRSPPRRVVLGGLSPRDLGSPQMVDGSASRQRGALLGLLRLSKGSSTTGEVDPGGGLTKVPDHPDAPERHQHVPGQVDLPPQEALAGGPWVEVVVVVPSLTEGQQRQHSVVARPVWGVVGPASPEVGHAVDGEGRMLHAQHRDGEAPHHGVPAAEHAEHASQHEGRQEIEAVDPHQLRHLQQIGDGLIVALQAVRREDPPQVRMPCPVEQWGVRVAGLVREAMVLSVMGRPPQHALLDGGLREPGEGELHRPGRPVAAMGEVSVVSGRDRDHAHGVHAGCEGQFAPAREKEQHAEHGECVPGEEYGNAEGPRREKWWGQCGLRVRVGPWSDAKTYASRRLKPCRRDSS